MTGGSHSRHRLGPRGRPGGVRPTTLARHAVGRHRSSLLGSGEQPDWPGAGDAAWPAGSRGAPARGSPPSVPPAARRQVAGGTRGRLAVADNGYGRPRRNRAWPEQARVARRRRPLPDRRAAAIAGAGRAATARASPAGAEDEAYPGSGAPDFGLAADLAARRDAGARRAGRRDGRSRDGPYREARYQEARTRSKRRPAGARRRRRAVACPGSSLATVTPCRRVRGQAGHRTQERRTAVDRRIPRGPELARHRLHHARRGRRARDRGVRRRRAACPVRPASPHRRSSSSPPSPPG